MAFQQVAAANERADDIENCLGRNNVRIVGLPEKVGGRDPTVLVERWLLEIFGKDAFTPLFTVEHIARHRDPHLLGTNPGPCWLVC